MASASRDNMVRSAAALIATHGVNATSFSDVLAASGAPRGSIYHHFPDGKRQLTRAAMDWTRDWVLTRQRDCPATTPAEVMDCFVGLWRLVVEASGGASGCAIAGVALDTDTSTHAIAGEDPTLIQEARAAFRGWTDLLTAQFTTAGLTPERSGTVAVTTLAALEGALILCRAEGGSGPLEIVAAELHRLLTA